MTIAKSLLYFVVTALFELGGTYLVWLWLREHKSAWYAVAGAAVLFVYGTLPTLQPEHFGRVQAAYSGIFLLIAIFWGWGMDSRPYTNFLLNVDMELNRYRESFVQKMLKKLQS
jgi:small multidrug resistance family-3 protein